MRGGRGMKKDRIFSLRPTADGMMAKDGGQQFLPGAKVFGLRRQQVPFCPLCFSVFVEKGTRMERFLPLAVACCLPILPLSAAEYLVDPHGSDTRSGLTPTEAFATVQRGLDAMKPGDTLTIAAGDYLGPARRSGIGGAHAVTTIRAAARGTVLLRGDRPAPAFRRLDGKRFTYVADLDGTTEAQFVHECDTLAILPRVPNANELEFVPGRFHHDVTAGRLYISTSDFQPPSVHRYTVSTAPTHGLYLSEAQRVVIDGLTVTGFNAARELHNREYTLNGTWGIFVAGGSRCVIRHCAAYLNGQGIGVNSYRPGSGENVVDHCTAWANGSDFGVGDRGGITLIDPSRDVVRHCTSFLNRHYGINIRGGARDSADRANASSLEDSFAWDNGEADFKIKTGYEHGHRTVRCLGGRPSNTLNPSHCLFAVGAVMAGTDTIILDREPQLDPQREFADPDNRDYRLQSTSRFRGAAPDGGDRGPLAYKADVFYVRPDGDDQADGLSLAGAWKTLSRAARSLRPGDTVYLSPGRYGGDTAIACQGTAAQPIAVRGRGREPAILEGTIRLAGAAHVNFARLQFSGTVETAEAEAIAFDHCRFPGSSPLPVQVGAPAPRIEPHRTETSPGAMRLVAGPVVRSVSAKTANIEWTTSLPATCRLAWGRTPACENSDGFDVDCFGTYSLTGLEPNTTYYFRIAGLRVPREMLPCMREAAADPTGEPISFTTAAADAAGRTYHVATDGDDTRNGLSRGEAWRTLQHAADMVNVGDTVLVAGGTYAERVRIRATGSLSAPITLRSAPGEKVILSGAGKSLNTAFYVAGKRHLRFDGLYFIDSNREKLQGWLLRLSGDFNLYRCGDIQITRCFSDGRNGYTARFITAWHTADLLIRNCVMINKMSGSMHLERCPDLRLENAVVMRPMIQMLILRNDANQKATFSSVLFTDMLEKKAKLNIAMFAVDAELGCPAMNNCGFFMRCFPPHERAVKGRLTAFDLAQWIHDPLFGDPLFAGDPLKPDPCGDRAGFPPDRLASPGAAIDFDSFFATDPQYVKRGIGLDRAAFADFHFAGR